MRITKKKVIVGVLVGGALLATLPVIAEADTGSGPAPVVVDASSAWPPSKIAPPGYYLWHVKLSGKKRRLEFQGYDSNGNLVADSTVWRRHSENAYFNPVKVATAELLFNGQPVSFTVDGKTVTRAPNNDDYCFALEHGQMREVTTGVGCNSA